MFAILPLPTRCLSALLIPMRRVDVGHGGRILHYIFDQKAITAMRNDQIYGRNYSYYKRIFCSLDKYQIKLIDNMESLSFYNLFVLLTCRHTWAFW